MAESDSNTNIPYLNQGSPDPMLAASITRASSRQTYYTIRFLVDHGMAADAYRAYGYFRWLDDRLDEDGMSRPERLALVERQKALIEACYRRKELFHQTRTISPGDAASAEETLLVDLIRNDRESNSGLRTYIHNMMEVMAFDAERRGRLISAEELARYTHWLAVAVTEALHYFIGRHDYSPRGEARYHAVSAAHITHMLRDTIEDTQAGYYNIPREYIELHGLDPQEIHSDAYRKWVQSRVRLARETFKAGESNLARVVNARCRMAGYAYIARFSGVLDAIQKDGYRLRAEYPECKSPAAGLRMVWSALRPAFIHQSWQNISRKGSQI
jgi:phytoene/squalene synthetase